MPRFNDPVEDLSKVKNIFLFVKTSFMRKKTFEYKPNTHKAPGSSSKSLSTTKKKKIRMNCLPMK